MGNKISAIDSKTENPTVKISCAYCQGTGKDRFGIMSALSTCPVCHGRGFHVVQYPLVNCAYCRGTGVSPIGGRYYCLACRGKGVHHYPNIQQNCSECKGSGVSKGGSGFYCSTCHGSGLKKRSGEAFA